MYCLQNLPRFSVLPLQSSESNRRKIFFSNDSLSLTNKADRHRSMDIKASSGSSDFQVKEKLSQTYSEKMTEASDAVLTYNHERGMNYTEIRSDLIVGSCLQTPADVDKLRAIGVKTIFCLQQDPDLEYFGVDIGAIQRYAKTFDDIEHVRAEIRDFDAFDLRIKLPAVISKLYKAIERNGGVTYIHCTAGLGRAPSVALAYLFWVQGYRLSKAHSLIVTQRECSPKVDAIKGATADILTGLERKRAYLTLKEDPNCSSVEIVGLDVGWGQRLPMRFDNSQLLWVLERELLEGRYEYKYIVNGDVWKYDDQKPTTNNGGNINNYIDVFEDDSSERASVGKRMFDDDVDLSPAERLTIKQSLESYPDH